MKDIPYAILHLWHENQLREQFEYNYHDYLGMSVGEFPLERLGEVDPMNLFDVGGGGGKIPMAGDHWKGMFATRQYSNNL